jgi:hypothetical protein
MEVRVFFILHDRFCKPFPAPGIEVFDCDPQPGFEDWTGASPWQLHTAIFRSRPDFIFRGYDFLFCICVAHALCLFSLWFLSGE